MDKTEKSNLPPEKDKLYNKIKLRLTIFSLTLDIIMIGLIAFSGISSFLMGHISPVSANEYMQFIMFITVLGLSASALTLPIDFYSGYILEHRFELSNQTIGKWIVEKLKGSAVSLTIGLPVALAFYFFLRASGDYWWIWFSTFIFFTSVFLARIAPIVIFPIFYKFRDLENDEIKEKITGLLEKHDINIKGIFSFNMSKDTKKANAGFTGIGKSKRIILSDTLIQDFTADEIAVIFAHEMGHYSHRHILKNLVQSTVIIFTSFYLCGTAYEMTLNKMGFTAVHDIAAIPILFFFLTIFGLVTMPFTNMISRRYEVQADAYAIDATGDRESFISSMEKLAEINLADRDPHPMNEFFFYSHPSIKKRVEFAKSYKGE